MKTETRDCITNLLVNTRSIGTVAYALSMELDCIDHDTRKDIEEVTRQLRNASETLAKINDRLPKPKSVGLIGFFKGVVR
jgi:hypothetical protein